MNLADKIADLPESLYPTLISRLVDRLVQNFKEDYSVGSIYFNVDGTPYALLFQGLSRLDIPVFAFSFHPVGVRPHVDEIWHYMTRLELETFLVHRAKIIDGICKNDVMDYCHDIVSEIMREGLMAIAEERPHHEEQRRRL